MLTLLYGLAVAAGCIAPARCTCFPPPEPRTPGEARTYVERAEKVFVGTVLRIETPGRSLRTDSTSAYHRSHEIVTVVVRERWRGAPPDTVTLHNSSQASMCGVDLQVGQSYFILANRRDVADSSAQAPLIPWGCDQSRPLTKARRILELLSKSVVR